MPIEMSQTVAYERLVTLAQERPANPEGIQSLVSAFARAILAAIHAGLTLNEIRAACRKGRDTDTQTTLDPSLDPEYWLRVYAEAESFWASRSGYTDYETFAD